MHVPYLKINLLMSEAYKPPPAACASTRKSSQTHETVFRRQNAGAPPLWMCEISIPVWSVNSRLSGGGVFRQSDGEGGIAELWRSRSRHHREHSGNAAAAQLVCSHDCQQIFSVLLQGKARRPHLAILPVDFKTAIAACKENAVQ